jgi:hemerythrin-like domain-containing protein
MPIGRNRRRFVAAGLLAGAAGLGAVSLHAKPRESEANNVEAVEDLMREHGVLRRALLVYTAASMRLRSGQAVPAEALMQTAQLFRRFGEEYHERMLEEQHVFPALVRKQDQVSHLAEVLKAQHERGRAITAYVLEVTGSGNLATMNVRPLSYVLDSFVLMYRHHAAVEDTLVFPAWRETVSEDHYRELSERFEDLEHQMFGADGYEDAVKRIASIEEAFGIADLAASTAPLPPIPEA